MIKVQACAREQTFQRGQCKTMLETSLRARDPHRYHILLQVQNTSLSLILVPLR